MPRKYYTPEQFLDTMDSMFRYIYIDYEDEQSMGLWVFFDSVKIDTDFEYKILVLSQASNRAGASMSIRYNKKLEICVEADENYATIIIRPDTGGEYIFKGVV